MDPQQRAHSPQRWITAHLRLADTHATWRTAVEEDVAEAKRWGLRLGAWIGNQRSRAATPTPERIEQLSTIGMRWA
ncbi:helicase associated domain-containing protein [Streptomyces sp. NPDC058239]|uniref:helicase associated domain-containing protein n=1 Tax=Streptomyces sp. NPDC058239 TaxID=3346395 RepID=UPI0036EF6687